MIFLSDKKIISLEMGQFIGSQTEASLAKAGELGGSVAQPITPIGEAGGIAVIVDPSGGVTGLAQYSTGPSE